MAAPMAGAWELKTAALIPAFPPRPPPPSAPLAPAPPGRRGRLLGPSVPRGPRRPVARPPATDHHVAVLLFAQAGHAAGHLLEALAVGGADLGQEVDVAAQAQAL